MYISSTGYLFRLIRVMQNEIEYLQESAETETNEARIRHLDEMQKRMRANLEGLNILRRCVLLGEIQLPGIFLFTDKQLGYIGDVETRN